MIGVDTNVVMRYLVTLDDAAQAAIAKAFVERSVRDGEQLYVNRIVLCEMFWVLKQTYRLPRERIVAVYDKLLEAAEFRVENEADLRQSVVDYEGKNIGIADGLLARTNVAAGCTTTVTFDGGAIASGMYSKP